MTGSRGVSGVLYLYGHLQAVRRGLVVLVVVVAVVRPLQAHLRLTSLRLACSTERGEVRAGGKWHVHTRAEVSLVSSRCANVEKNLVN